jgi:hypothetical protein
MPRVRRPVRVTGRRGSHARPFAKIKNIIPNGRVIPQRAPLAPMDG